MHGNQFAVFGSESHRSKRDVDVLRVAAENGAEPSVIRNLWLTGSEQVSTDDLLTMARREPEGLKKFLCT